MGAVDTPEGGVKHKKGGMRRRQPKRIGVKIDMTPMVDVAFLLLIFFMVTTVFRTPQALEINLPPKEDVKVDVAQSKVLEVRVLPDQRVFWRNAQDPWARTTIPELEKVFAPWKTDDEKIVVVRIDRDAKFNNMVDIIDELDLANLTRFSLQTMNETEKKEVEVL